MQQNYPTTAAAPMPGFTIHGGIGSSISSNYDIPQPATQPATLTDKAAQVRSLTIELRQRLDHLQNRLWPAPQQAESSVKNPVEPDALPWMLEAAEQELNNALGLLQSIIGRV